MKKIIIILLFFSLFFPNIGQAYDQIINAKNPKTANAFLSWEMTKEDAVRLARFDLLILDMEQQINHPELIKLIRETNPQITILAYISSQEIRNDTAVHSEISLRQEMFSYLPESWYLRDANGWKISFWDKTWMINLSDYSDLKNNERWNDYLPRFIEEKILSTGLWDGIFYDNLWDSVSWLNDGNIDIDNNGQVDEVQKLNIAWQQGVLKILQKTRKRVGYDYILMANSSSFSAYQPYLNGRMFEDFPSPYEENGSWWENIESYQKIKSLNVHPNIYIFNSTNTPLDNYSKMRYGLVSTLLFDDIYFSFDNSIYNHGQTWWYDEYDFNLGLPLGPARMLNGIEGVWRRDFSNGLVFLNESGTEKSFVVDSGYKKIFGQQDRVVNSGGEVSAVTIGPKDGLILEPVLKISSIYLKNYYHYEAYNYNGYKIHSDYQWGSDDYQNRELIKQEKNGQYSWIKSREVRINNLRIEGSPEGHKSLIKIYNEKNKLVGIFRAYPDDLKAGVKIAVGDLNGDKKIEIAALPAYGPPHLKIFDLKSNLLKESWLGFSSDYNYYDLTLSDINFDFLPEILITRW